MALLSDKREVRCDSDATAITVFDLTVISRNTRHNAYWYKTLLGKEECSRKTLLAFFSPAGLSVLRFLVKRKAHFLFFERVGYEIYKRTMYSTVDSEIKYT